MTEAIETNDNLIDDSYIDTLREIIAGKGSKGIVLSALERIVYPNPNTSKGARAQNRTKLEAYLELYAPRGGWEIHGKRVLIPGLPESAPPQGTFAVEGMAHQFEDDAIAEAAHQWSVASHLRQQAQEDEAQAKATLTALLEARGADAGEQKMPNEAHARYSFEDRNGKIMRVYWHTEPASSKPKTEKPAKAPKGDEE